MKYVASCMMFKLISGLLSCENVRYVMVGLMLYVFCKVIHRYVMARITIFPTR